MPYSFSDGIVLIVRHQDSRHQDVEVVLPKTQLMNVWPIARNFTADVDVREGELLMLLPLGSPSGSAKIMAKIMQQLSDLPVDDPAGVEKEKTQRLFRASRCIREAASMTKDPEILIAILKIAHKEDIAELAKSLYLAAMNMMDSEEFWWLAQSILDDEEWSLLRDHDVLKDDADPFSVVDGDTMTYQGILRRQVVFHVLKLESIPGIEPSQNQLPAAVTRFLRDSRPDIDALCEVKWFAKSTALILKKTWEGFKTLEQIIRPPSSTS